jgi:4-hydroxybenzoate polyprenyltransferase
MILTIVAILVLFWLIGVFFHLLGAFIHLALIIAACLFVYDILVVRRRRDKK